MGLLAGFDYQGTPTIGQAEGAQSVELVVILAAVGLCLSVRPRSKAKPNPAWWPIPKYRVQIAMVLARYADVETREAQTANGWIHFVSTRHLERKIGMIFSRLLKQFEMPNFLSPGLLPQNNSPKPNRRAWERFPTKVEVFCQKARGEDELQWSAHVMDISRGGLKLLIPHKFEPATVLRIARSDWEEKDSRVHKAVVVRASRESVGKWCLGCAFVEVLSEEAFAGIVREK
jgi:hypothetical protein